MWITSLCSFSVLFILILFHYSIFQQHSVQHFAHICVHNYSRCWRWNRKRKKRVYELTCVHLGSPACGKSFINSFVGILETHTSTFFKNSKIFQKFKKDFVLKIKDFVFILIFHILFNRGWFGFDYWPMPVVSVWNKNLNIKIKYNLLLVITNEKQNCWPSINI